MNLNHWLMSKSIQVRSIAKLGDLIRLVVIEDGLRLVADKPTLEECFDSVYEISKYTEHRPMEVYVAKGGWGPKSDTGSIQETINQVKQESGL